MPEKYKFMIEHTPFLIGAAGNAKLNYTRIIETLIIVVLTAMGSSYMTVEKISYKMETLNERVMVLEADINRLHPRGYPSVPE